MRPISAGSSSYKVTPDVKTSPVSEKDSLVFGEVSVDDESPPTLPALPSFSRRCCSTRKCPPGLLIGSKGGISTSAEVLETSSAGLLLKFNGPDSESEDSSVLGKLLLVALSGGLFCTTGFWSRLAAKVSFAGLPLLTTVSIGVTVTELVDMVVAVVVVVVVAATTTAAVGFKVGASR